MEKVTLGPFDLNKAKILTDFLEAKKIPFDADLQNPSDLVGFRDVFRSEINTPEINVQISKEDFSKHEDFFSRKDLCFLKNNFLQKSNPI